MISDLRRRRGKRSAGPRRMRASPPVLGLTIVLEKSYYMYYIKSLYRGLLGMVTLLFVGLAQENPGG
jgi:hypothetical protein